MSTCELCHQLHSVEFQGCQTLEPPFFLNTNVDLCACIACLPSSFPLIAPRDLRFSLEASLWASISSSPFSRSGPERRTTLRKTRTRAPLKEPASHGGLRTVHIPLIRPPNVKRLQNGLCSLSICAWTPLNIAHAKFLLALHRILDLRIRNSNLQTNLQRLSRRAVVEQPCILRFPYILRFPCILRL